MKIRILTVGNKTPLEETMAQKIRVTTFAQAKPSSAAEAVLIMRGGSIRSIVSQVGSFDLYLSPRAKYTLIPAKLEQETHCCCDHRNANVTTGCPDCGKAVDACGVTIRSAR